MKPIDLSDLIKGLLVVIGISVVCGKYNELSAWARKEAFGQKKSRPERSKRTLIKNLPKPVSSC